MDFSLQGKSSGCSVTASVTEALMVNKVSTASSAVHSLEEVLMR